jgi:hypothetical protein
MPPLKRRRLPRSFQLADELARGRREQAATRLARFWRWRRGLRQQLDPLSLQPLTPRLTLRLVEDRGVHNYDALALTNYFLRSGRFASPLTRREITATELRRLQQKCPSAELRALLHSTYMARAAIAAVDYSLEIQRMAAENDVGDALERLLAEAESSLFDPNWSLLHHHLDAYETALQLFAERYGGELAALCNVHAEIVERRGLLCPEALLTAVRDIQAAAKARRLASADVLCLAFARLVRSLSGWMEQWR